MVLMKWDCPRMKLFDSGFSIVTVVRFMDTSKRRLSGLYHTDNREKWQPLDGPIADNGKGRPGKSLCSSCRKPVSIPFPPAKWGARARPPTAYMSETASPPTARKRPN